MGLPGQWTEVPTDETAKATIFTTMLDSSFLMLKINESLGASLKYDGYDLRHRSLKITRLTSTVPMTFIHSCP